MNRRFYTIFRVPIVYGFEKNESFIDSILYKTKIIKIIGIADNIIRSFVRVDELVQIIENTIKLSIFELSIWLKR